MSDSTFHLAQANISLSTAPLTDPVMASFVEQLDYINSVADNAPGFVWRLKDEEGGTTPAHAFNDPLILINMSMWESIEALYAYVFESDHLGPLRARRSWFTKMDRPQSVLWWQRRGEFPDIPEAERRLDLLHELGPTPEAFTFARLFDPEGRPIVRSPGIDRECGV